MNKRINKLKKKFNRLCVKLNKEFDTSYSDVLVAFELQSTCGSNKAFLAGCYNLALAEIDESGNPYNILMYFPDMHDIHITRHYLEAYLITNRDVLEAVDIQRLEYLLERYK